MIEALRVLIVDDSPLMRRTLRALLESDPWIKVVGEAANGEEALLRVDELGPDVITMDVRMPVLDGLQTTEQLMAYHPTPILVLTASLSSYDVDITFKMLGAGALDVMEKPRLTDKESFERARRELVRKVKLLSRVQVVTHLRGRRRPAGAGHLAPMSISVSDDALAGQQSVAPLVRVSAVPAPGMALVVIGASTGGPRVLRQILSGLPRSFGAAILVVQHIAAGFSGGMAEWLSETVTLPVALAQEGLPIKAGQIIVAQDRYDLLVQPDHCIHLSANPLLLQRPSVDITMQSAAEVYGASVIGVLLTGMGRDGAFGMRSIRRAGGYTIAQNEATSLIFGMPRAAIELRAVDMVLPPGEIITALLNRVAIL